MENGDYRLLKYSNPKQWLIDTKSQQQPFYFGGSQIPVNLFEPKAPAVGSGLKKKKIKIIIKR